MKQVAEASTYLITRAMLCLLSLGENKAPQCQNPHLNESKFPLCGLLATFVFSDVNHFCLKKKKNLKDQKNFVGSGVQIRVGRVIGNQLFFFLGRVFFCLLFDGCTHFSHRTRKFHRALRKPTQIG